MHVRFRLFEVRVKRIAGPSSGAVGIKYNWCFPHRFIISPFYYTEGCVLPQRAAERQSSPTVMFFVVLVIVTITVSPLQLCFGLPAHLPFCVSKGPATVFREIPCPRSFMQRIQLCLSLRFSV